MFGNSKKIQTPKIINPITTANPPNKNAVRKFPVMKLHFDVRNTE